MCALIIQQGEQIVTRHNYRVIPYLYHGRATWQAAVVIYGQTS